MAFLIEAVTTGDLAADLAEYFIVEVEDENLACDMLKMELVDRINLNVEVRSMGIVHDAASHHYELEQGDILQLVGDVSDLVQRIN